MKCAECGGEEFEQMYGLAAGTIGTYDICVNCSTVTNVVPDLGDDGKPFEYTCNFLRQFDREDD